MSHARNGSSGFEPTLEFVRNIADLDHDSHVQKLRTCFKHVDAVSAWSLTAPHAHQVRDHRLWRDLKEVACYPRP